MIKRVGIHSVGLLFLICTSVGSAWAQGVRGFYLSHDIGLNVAPKVVLRGTTSDRASVCDEFINPLYAAVGGCTSLNRGAGDGWSTAFKRARGILSGAAVGYRFTDRIRVEERYSYRESAYASERSGHRCGWGIVRQAGGRNRGGERKHQQRYIACSFQQRVLRLPQ